MSFKHTAPVKAKNLCDLITMLSTILQGDHFEASKTLVSQVQAQADELSKDLQAEVDFQIQQEVIEKETPVELSPPEAPPVTPTEPPPPMV